MSFGKRSALPSPEAPSRPFTPSARERSGSGRIGYLWALMAVAVSCFVGPAIMATLPAINRSGHTQGEIAVVTLKNVLPSLLVVCAIVLPLVDLGLKALNRRIAWLYAVISGFAAVLIFQGLMSIGSPSNPLWILRIVLGPAALGGYILGMFRSR